VVFPAGASGLSFLQWLGDTKSIRSIKTPVPLVLQRITEDQLHMENGRLNEGGGSGGGRLQSVH